MRKLNRRYIRQMAGGAGLMIVAWFVLAFQSLDWITRSFLISLPAFALSLVGFVLAMHGLVQVVRVNRRERDQG